MKPAEARSPDKKSPVLLTFLKQKVMEINIRVERLYSFKEIAEELGVSEDELFRGALEEGLIHPDGSPTEYAIKEGILTVVPPINLRLN